MEKQQEKSCFVFAVVPMNRRGGNKRRQGDEHGAVHCPVCRRDVWVQTAAGADAFAYLCRERNCQQHREEFARSQGWDKRLPPDAFQRLCKESSVMGIAKGGRTRRLMLKLPRNLAVGDTPRGHSLGRCRVKQQATVWQGRQIVRSWDW